MSFVSQESGCARASSVIDMPNCCCLISYLPQTFSPKRHHGTQTECGVFKRGDPSGEVGSNVLSLACYKTYKPL